MPTITDYKIVGALADLGYRATTLGGNAFNSCMHILDNEDHCKQFLAKLGTEGASGTAERVIREALGWPMPYTPTEEKRMAKKTETKKDGVIASLKVLCAKGATLDEIIESLGTEFPDRDPLKMRSTVRTQLGGRLAASGFTVSKEKVEGRGLVYKIAA